MERSSGIDGLRDIFPEVASKFVNNVSLLVHNCDIGWHGKAYAIRVRVDQDQTRLILLGQTVATSKGGKITIHKGVPTWIVDAIEEAVNSIESDDLSALLLDEEKTRPLIERIRSAE